MHLVLRWNFDQADLAIAPVADGFDPQTWPCFKMRFQVLVGVEITLALQQAEAARVVIVKAAHLKIGRIGEHAPQRLAAAIAHEQTVGIVHRGPKVVDTGSVVRIEEKHAGHRRDAGFRNIDTRVHRHLDIVDRDLTRPDRNPIGRGRAFAVEQSVNDDGVGFRLRLLDPERLEKRKLLALGFRGVDRKPARGQPIGLALGDGAEVAGTEKDADFVEIVRAVDRRVDAESGKAEIGIRRRRLHVLKSEQARRIADRLRLALTYLENVDTVREKEAAVKQLKLKWRSLASPDRLLRHKADLAILVVVEVFQIVGKFRVRRDEGLLGQLLREPPHT